MTPGKDAAPKPEEWDWKGRRVAVVGLGVSNRALIRFLVAEGARVTGFDRQPLEAMPAVAEEMERLKVPVISGPGYLERSQGSYDAVFLTPGIRRDEPGLRELVASAGRVLSEMELFFRLCPAPIVAVTGSNGKTTTTSLIGRILSLGPRPVWVGGNIGTPLIDRVREIQPSSWVVLELSSFQLEFLTASPHIGVVTNFQPNHLDVHPSLEAYWEAKARIFRFQKRGDWAVFNADDAEVARMAGGPGRAFPFSRRRRLSQGAFLVGDDLVVRGPGEGETAVASIRDLQIPGWHNVENALAAVAAARLCGLEAGLIREGLRSFEGVPHRLETVAEIDGVRFINDSIATSPSRTAAALRALQAPVVLIAGGYDKKLSFQPMVDAMQEARVKAVVLLGATADKIAKALETLPAEGRPPVYRVASLEEAVHQARRLAVAGDVVLLSPACASYDMFANFEARGQAFRDCVRRLQQMPRGLPVGVYQEKV